MKRYISSLEYDRSFTYNYAGQNYRVYVKFENDPDSFQFQVSEIHPYDLADYAWAVKRSPSTLEIISEGVVIDHIHLPEWGYDVDEDDYENIAEYEDDLIDRACSALQNANRNVRPMIDRT